MNYYYSCYIVFQPNQSGHHKVKLSPHTDVRLSISTNARNLPQAIRLLVRLAL